MRSRRRVQSVALSGDGTRAAVAEEEETSFKVWDLDDGSERLTSEEHPGPVLALAFDPDGKRIASSAVKGYTPGDAQIAPSLIRVSDAATGRAARNIWGPQGYVARLAFTQKGTVLGLDFDEWLRAYSATDGAEVFTAKGTVGRSHGRMFESIQSAFGASADGLHAASLCTAATIPGGAPPDRIVNLWDGDHARCRTLYVESSPLRSVAISPDGSRVLAATVDQQVMGFDFVSGRKLFSFYPGTNLGGIGPYFLAFSPDGARFVIGKRDGVLRLYKIEDGRAKHIDWTRGPRAYVRALAFLPDRLRVVSGGYAEAGFTRHPGGSVTMNYEPLWVWDALLETSRHGNVGFVRAKRNG